MPQTTIQLAQAALSKGLIGPSFDPTKFYIIEGCVNSGSGSHYIISAGAIFSGPTNEILEVDAIDIIVNSGETLVGKEEISIVRMFNADNATGTDDWAPTKPDHVVKKLVFKSGVMGSSDVNFDDLLVGSPISSLPSNNVTFNPSNPSDWFPIPTLVSDALNQLASKKECVQIMISSLNPSGVWFPNEFVGPTFGSSSSGSVLGFGHGVGFARVTKTGVLKNFKYTNASPSGSNVNVDLYQAPNGNPFLLSYTGVSISMLAGDFIAENTVDTLSVTENDILVFYNNSGFVGYTPDALTITGDLYF